MNDATKRLLEECRDAITPVLYRNNAAYQTRVKLTGLKGGAMADELSALANVLGKIGVVLACAEGGEG